MPGVAVTTPGRKEGIQMKKFNYATIAHYGTGDVIQNHDLKTIRGVKNRIFRGYIEINDNVEYVEIWDNKNNLLEVVDGDEIRKNRYNKVMKTAKYVGQLDVDGEMVDIYRGVLIEDNLGCRTGVVYKYNDKYYYNRIRYDRDFKIYDVTENDYRKIYKDRDNNAVYELAEYFEIGNMKIYIHELKNN